METTQVRLRNFKDSDLADFYDYVKIDGLGEAAGWRHADNLQQAELMLANLQKNLNSYAIEDKITLQVIGHLTVYEDSVANDPTVKELGFVLHPDFRRRGIMSEVVNAVLENLFNHGVETVYACSFKENLASQRLIEKLGFVFEQEGTYTSPSLQETFASNEYFMTADQFHAPILYRQKEFTVSRLTQATAEIIANNWKYPAEYAFYDLAADPEDYEEILSAEKRGDQYYQVFKAGELFGYFVLEPAENPAAIVFGLGMKPELTGQGLGQEFFAVILGFIKENYSVREIQLAVAKFNLRAQRLYQNVGFVKTGEYLQATNGAMYPFVTMALTV